MDKPWKVMVLIGLEGIVAGLVSWLAIGFLPSATGEAVYNAMFVLFLSGAGITVIVYGNVTKNSNFYILGFAFLLLALFVVIDRYEGFAVKISAFAMLIMAFAAFVSIYVTIGEGRRVRQDSIERGSRDRKERLIDEVAKWLRELEGRIFPRSSEFYSGIEDKITESPEIHAAHWLQLKALNIVMGEMHNLDESIKEAEYYRKLTLKLNEELSSLIEVIVEKLEQRKQLHVEAAENEFDYGVKLKEAELLQELVGNDDRPLEGLGLSEHDILAVGFGRNAYAASKSILNAVDKVIEIKTSFIQDS